MSDLGLTTSVCVLPSAVGALCVIPVFMVQFILWLNFFTSSLYCSSYFSHFASFVWMSSLLLVQLKMEKWWHSLKSLWAFLLKKYFVSSNLFFLWARLRSPAYLLNLLKWLIFLQAVLTNSCNSTSESVCAGECLELAHPSILRIKGSLPCCRDGWAWKFSYYFC